MSELNIPHPVEQALACRSLVVVAKNTSNGMDKFVQWMLTAFAAGLTYLLGQQQIPFTGLRTAGLIYLVAALFGITQRYFAMVVSNAANVFSEGEKLHDNKVPIDLARFFIIYIESLSGFMRWGAAWAAAKFIKGDLIATGKGLMALAFVQCALGFACTALLFVAFYVTLRGI